MLRNALKELEDWVNGAKARYISDMGIDDGYGATCWSLTLGNTSVKPGEGWHKGSAWAKKNNKAELYVYEAQFLRTKAILPNVIFVMGKDDDDWPGLEKTILVALSKATELGL